MIVVEMTCYECDFIAYSDSQGPSIIWEELVSSHPHRMHMRTMSQLEAAVMLCDLEIGAKLP